MRPISFFSLSLSGSLSIHSRLLGRHGGDSIETVLLDFVFSTCCRWHACLPACSPACAGHADRRCPQTGQTGIAIAMECGIGSLRRCPKGGRSRES